MKIKRKLLEYKWATAPFGVTYCLCGCDNLIPILSEWGYEQGYVYGHNMRGKVGSDSSKFKDMSDRYCTICGTTLVLGRLD